MPLFPIPANKTINHLVFWAYGLFITGLSLKPQINIGEAAYNDKVAHFLAYSILTLLAWRLVKGFRHFTFVCIGITLYSGLIEVIQPYTGRTLSFYDLLANIAGVVVTGLTLYLLYRNNKITSLSP